MSAQPARLEHRNREVLSAPKGAEDTCTREQRYHDALQDAIL